jgi:hypothetical protein
MTIEYLKLPSSNHAFTDGVRIERAPMVYAPPSTTEFNTVRLPSFASLKQMQLRYREKFFSDDELQSIALGKLHQIFWTSLALAIGMVIVGPIVPFLAAAAVVGAFSFFLALNAVVRRNATPMKLGLTLLVPVLALAAIEFLGFLIVHRTLAAVFFGGITFAVFYKLGKRPFAFYRDWLYTNPRLTPESMADPIRIPIHPNLPLLVAVLGIAAIVPLFSPAIAIAAIIAMCLVVLGKDLNPFVSIPKLKTVFGQYLTYGMASTLAPGVWIPHYTYRARRAYVWALCASLFATLATSLFLFSPWDVLRWKIRGDYGADVLAASYDAPFSWVFPVLQGLIDADPVYLWVFPVALGLAIVLPFLVLTAVFKKPLAAAHDLYLKIEGSKSARPIVDEDPRRSEWQWYVDRIRTSKHVCEDPFGIEVREAEHLFLGVEPNAQFPVLLDKEILKEHCYIVGDTGSGKTAVGITPLLLQLVRGHRSKDDTTTPPPPMVVLDLKGDYALFHTLREESAKRRKHMGITDPDDARHAFRFFTPEKGRASYFFNPFQSLDTEARSEIQLCHLILDSLGLNHGEGYGRSYYSRKSRMMLLDALTKGPRPRSIEELYKRLKQFTGEHDDLDRLTGDFNYKHDTFELLATIHTLSKYEMLATTANLDNPELSIHMPEVIQEGQIAYFWLPAALESISVREIAKLAIFSLLTAAIDRQREKGTGKDEPKQVYLVIDEFQRIAGENFKVILEQARSFGISAILANQTQSDLNTHDIDLRPTVRGNTRTKMFFSVTDPEEERVLSEASGQELAMLESGFGGFSDHAAAAAPAQWSQSLKPRLTRNDIMRVSDHPLEYILKVSRGSGFTQFGGMPIPVRTTYPLTKDLFEERKRLPWPPSMKATVVPTKSPEEHDASTQEFSSRAMSGLEDFVREKLEA